MSGFGIESGQFLGNILILRESKVDKWEEIVISVLLQKMPATLIVQILFIFQSSVGQNVGSDIKIDEPILALSGWSPALIRACELKLPLMTGSFEPILT